MIHVTTMKKHGSHALMEKATIRIAGLVGLGLVTPPRMSGERRAVTLDSSSNYFT